MDAQQGGGVKWPEESDKLFLCGKTSFAMMEVRETIWSPGIVPEDNTQPYLQVNFGNFTRVTGVEIEKRLYAGFRTIENFTLQKSRDLKTFTDHENV
ncbi:unnamed protein product, partial [Darwinula stevensoni]